MNEQIIGAIDLGALPINPFEKTISKIPLVNGKIEKRDNLYLREFLKSKKLDYNQYFFSKDTLKKIKIDKEKEFKPRFIIDRITLVDQKNRKVKLSDYHDLKEAKISEKVYEKFETETKNWTLNGLITLEYTIERDEFYISDIEILEFKATIEEWIEYKNSFKTSTEWIDNILYSLGYNSTKLMLREKIFILIRLIPLVQNNVNIIEITKREIGKTYLYQTLFQDDCAIKNTTSSTEANLFYNINKDKLGEIFDYPVVCFDEIHKASLKEEIFQELQMFGETGVVSRAKKSATASLIFYGNIDEKISKKIYVGKGINLFEKIKAIDSGFLDRIHYLNPTWGMRTLNSDLLLESNTQFYQTMERVPVGYLAKVFSELRNIELDKSVLEKIGYNFKMNERDSIALKKITLGFLKLIYPELIQKLSNNSMFTPDEYNSMAALIYLAMEGRNSIKKQIAIMNEKIDNLEIEFSYNNILIGERVINLGDELIFYKIVEIFTDKNLSDIELIQPHRIIYRQENKLIKEAIDLFGEEENKEEFLQMLEWQNRTENEKIKISKLKLEFLNDSNFIDYQYSTYIYNNIYNNYNYAGYDLSYGYKNIHNYYIYKKNQQTHMLARDPLKNYLYGYSIRPTLERINIHNYNNFSSLTSTNVVIQCSCEQISTFLIIDTERYKCNHCGKIYYSFELFPEKF